MTRKGLASGAARRNHRAGSAARAGRGRAVLASPWRTPRDRGAERQVKREAVLRVAGQLFVERGFHATYSVS